MYKLRSLVVWLLIYAQIWVPALAQTLPISVDKNVPGQRPVVGVSNGVPVVNIAPPSAGGVSNNHYSQFNVGPSGVVLNNSGGASQTQLAGQIGGNPMLGNQHASTILNQVTAPNPSQLMGILEVGGHRANVIVANPAGITCNGCGFLNADRAMLTTGRPQLLPDGAINVDVASGRLSVEGEGLYGANLSRLDLIARSLEINANVWADRLNVVAGANRVDYATGEVVKPVAASGVALDTAVLGGMYANSIRLIGTEAGVGVNIGNELVAMTGDLEVSAAGDVRFKSTGMAQSAGNMKLTAGQDMAVEGKVSAVNGGLSLSGGDVAIGSAASVLAGHAVNIAAQRSLSSAGQIHGIRSVDIQTGVDLSVQAGGVVQGAENLSLSAGRNLTIAEAGVATAGSPATLRAGQTLRIDGIATTLNGNLNLIAGEDLTLGGAGRAQASHALKAQAGGNMALAGTVASVKDIMLTVAHDIRVDGTVASDAALTIQARNLNTGANALLQAAGNAAFNARANIGLAGKAIAQRNLTLDAGNSLVVDGSAAALEGDLRLTAQAGDLRLGEQAHAQAVGKLYASAGRDVFSSGSMAASRDIDLRALGDIALNGIAVAQSGALQTQAGGKFSVSSSGRLQSAGDLSVVAGSTFDNAGTLWAGEGLSLSASQNLNNMGSVMAGGNVLATTSALLSNAGQMAAGVDDDGGLTKAASLSLKAGNLDSSGSVLAGSDLLLSAGRINLSNGTVSAQDAMSVTSLEDLITRGAHLNGESLNLSAAALDNREGKLTSDGRTVIHLTGTLDNTDGVIASADGAQVQAASVLNQGGKLVARDLELTALNKIVNTDGLIHADEFLALTAVRLDNSQGSIVAAKAMDMRVDALSNAGGKLEADERLSVAAQTVDGVGTLQSVGDLSLTVNAGLVQDGMLAAGRDLTLVVGADLVNQGSVSAGRDLAVGASNLDNRTDGQLIAGRASTLNIAQAMNNAGLIDGGATRIDAGSLTNTGRIYGDAIAIQTGTLTNEAGSSGAGVIASRGDLDIGASKIINREHALLLALGDLRIGGTLDANGRAIGQAASLENASATIEVSGNADISAASIQNLNNHFSSEVVHVGTTPKVYYRPEGTTDMYDGAETWLCDLVTPLCSKDATWLGGDQERRLLLSSPTYPESRYGPPFDYTPYVKGTGGIAAPILLAYAPEWENCTGGDNGGDCTTVAEKFNYPADSKVWSVFGVEPPVAQVPTPPPPADCRHMTIPECDIHKAQTQEAQDAYVAAMAAYRATFKELDERIRAFNADFAGRLVKNFTIYRVDESVSESRTVSTDPGSILVSGNAVLTGSVVNDKSRIVAGGELSVNGPAIANVGATGERRIEQTGTATRTFEDDGDRKYNSPQPYTGALSAALIELAVAAAGGGQSVSLGNGAPGASAASKIQGPVEMVHVVLPGNSEVRTVDPQAVIPDSQLYAVTGRGDAPYLVGTDSQFVGQRQFVSSDFLLDLLQQAGGRLQGQLKRLGDGFFEQKMISDQILAITGQRFLENYANADEQYKALLSSGANYALAQGIKLGVALTEAQMRLLTTDLVWLVEREVIMPDGSVEHVLVPQVYLVVREGDLKGDGTLMAARNVNLVSQGDIVNSGTIGARAAVVMSAANIVNQSGGRIEASILDLGARQDLVNVAALIKGDVVALSAGRDMALTSTTTNFDHGATSGVNLGGLSQIDAGSLNMVAGRDISMTAADVAVKNDAYLQAGRDINLATVTQSHDESYVFGRRNNSAVSTSSEIGTTLAAGGQLTLAAGQDVNARAADVTAGGRLAVGAGRDINVDAGEATGAARDELYYKTKGFLSSRTTHTIKSTDWTQGQGSTLTGDTTVLMAGRGINVRGSNVAAQHDAVISADRDVNIAAGGNTSDNYQYKKVTKSGFGALGGISYGSRKQTDSLDGKQVFHTASTVGSVEGDVLINAGNALNVAGSNVLARQGDITLIGREVNIVAVNDTAREHEFHEIKQTGLTVTASTPLVSVMQTGLRMSEAAGKTDNQVMQGLALATTGLAAVNAYDAVMANPSQAGGLSVKISLGTSKSSSTTDRQSSTAVGSTIAAGGDLTVMAQGGGSASGITVTGSNLSAGNNAVLKAEGDVLLQAAANTATQKTDSKSSSGSIGIGFSTGQKTGLTLEMGVSTARGSADGQDTSWTSSTITAGNILALQSGGDTTLKGALAKAGQVIASVGEDLRIESLQDSSTYDAKNQSGGVGVSLCLPPYCMGSSSISANAEAGKMNSNYESVVEQSGIWAADGGFQIDVAGNTALVGAVIAGSDKAIADGRNQLVTGTLVVQDIENHAKYSASQVAVGGGLSWGGASPDLGTNKDGQVAGGASKETGTSVPATGGFGMGAPMVAAASGTNHSTTQGAISAGTIVIRDEAGQQALTGQSAAEAIASLNRDTTDTLNTLAPIFDKEKIEAGFEVVSEASRQMGQFLTNRAQEADAVKGALEHELAKGEQADPERLAALNAQYGQMTTWLPGGDARNVMTVVMAAAAGNVTGSAGDVALNAALGYLQAQGAQQIKKLVSSMPPGPEAEAMRAILQGLLACGSAVGQSADCASAAAGASVSSILEYLLAPSPDASQEEIEARGNLLNSIVASVVDGLGGEAATASAAGRIESDNNAFYVNRTYVAEVTGKPRAELEQMFVDGTVTPADYEQGVKSIDAASSKIDALLTIYNIQSASGLSQSLGQMAPAHLELLSEAVVGLLSAPGMASAAYELITGTTVVSKDEANYFFAALGIIPGTQLAKGVSKAGELAQVLADPGKVSAIRQIALNQAKGVSFEKAYFEYLGVSKNTTSFTANVNGRLVTVIPDGVMDGDRILEIKDVMKLSNSDQFRAYAALSEAGGTIMKGGGSANGSVVTFEAIDLIVSPGTRISKSVAQMITDSGGSIQIFNVAEQSLTPWSR